MATRDAIHIATFEMVAGEHLYPGYRIRLQHGTANVALSTSDDYLGIVDPFSDGLIREGEKFIAYLKPNSVDGMVHHWHHPIIDAEPIQCESENWLRAFASKWNMDYATMMREAKRKDGYIVARGIDLHSRGELGEDESLFWSHYEKVTGEIYDQNHREDFGWTCSC